MREKEERLFENLRGMGRMLVAFSGGTDSAYLAWAAHRAVGAGALAVTADSASIPESHRGAFLDQNHELVRDVFYRPAGYLLKSYPSCPAAWLCDERFASEVPDAGQHELVPTCINKRILR